MKNVSRRNAKQNILAERFARKNVSGSRDFRMVMIAGGYWAGCLLGRFLCKMQLIYGVTVVVIGFIVALIALFCVQYKNVSWGRTISLIAYVSLVACMASYFSQCVLYQDVIMREIQAGNATQLTYSKNYETKRNYYKSDHDAEFTLVTPLRASQSFNGDCQATVRVHNFDGQKSNVTTRFYAYNPLCNKLSYGMRVNVPVSVSASRYDNTRPELHVEKLQQNARVARVVKRADFWHRSVSGLWKSFYEVTNQLDAQGRMLVPGVTIGMLGQEYVPTEATNSLNTIDATYANMTRQHFQHAGIMHVMAVSGGHFLLLSMIIYRCCAYLLLPRWVTSSIQIVLQIALAAIVYPSASVLRALIMGIISAIAFCLKRPYQSASALSWTVIGVLLVNPSYAWDYAFSLSVAATLGIVIMGVPLSKILLRYMPSFIASAISITFSAQFWTMPVQILMQPEVSFMSIPANVIAAPLMEWSTVCGLISLISAGFCSALSLTFAQLSAIGTGFMEKCACYCDEISFGVFPWMKGTAGACLMAFVELIIFAIFMLSYRSLYKRNSIQRMSIIGQLFSSSFKRMLSDAEQIFEE